MSLLRGTASPNGAFAYFAYRRTRDAYVYIGARARARVGVHLRVRVYVRVCVCTSAYVMRARCSLQRRQNATRFIQSAIFVNRALATDS